jgi:hypothetical protein
MMLYKVCSLKLVIFQNWHSDTNQVDNQNNDGDTKDIWK